MVYADTKPEICADEHPFLSLLKIVGVILGAFFVVQFISVLIIFGMGIDIDVFSQALTNPFDHPELKPSILLIQGVTSLVVFIAAPLFYILTLERKNLSSLNAKRVTLIPILLAGFIVVSFMAFNSLIIQWNQEIDFPPFLDFFEKWAKSKEGALKDLTEFLTSFDSPVEFLIGLIVIAIIPGVGEELLFRGLIQNKLFASIKNIHLAIWLSAFIFSAFHFQFFGFVPRMLLGALFGYMYYWSGSIWIPICAHFVNNGFTVLALYLFKLKYVEYNIEETTSVPIQTALLGLVLTSGLLFSFWRYYSGKNLHQ